MTPDLPSALVAFQHWIEALNAGGDEVQARAALTDGIVIERYGFHDRRGQVVERIEGLADARHWLAMTRPVCRFFLVDGSVQVAGGLVAARYRLTAPIEHPEDGDAFVGGGTWQARLSDDGRIAWLRHEPDDLDERWGMPVPEAEHRHEP